MSKSGEVQMNSRNRPPKTFVVNERELYILVEDNGLFYHHQYLNNNLARLFSKKNLITPKQQTI